jgi:predicted SAM-dependent methyltransferase
LFKIHSVKKKILNLGCGDQKYGTHRVDIHKTKTTTHVFDVEEGIKFPDNYFDVVYEKTLLEHLRNPGYHFEELYRVLKSGGKLILITDYAGCFRYYLFGTHEGRYEKKHKDNPDDRHYALFTKSHIRNHLIKVGFKEFQVELIGTDYVTKFFDKIFRFKPRIKVVAIK